jgi:hypothetical protein
VPIRSHTRLSGATKAPSPSVIGARSTPLRPHSIHALAHSIESVHQLASTTRGPFGCAKLVHMNPLSPSVSIQQSCAAFTSSLSLSRSNIGGAVLLQLVSRGLESIAEGGWTTLQLACGLLGKHFDSVIGSAADRVLSVSVRAAGQHLALRWCIDFLTPDFPARQAADMNHVPSSLRRPVCSVQLSNLPVLLSLIRSQLWSKQSVLHLREDERQFLAVLVVQAFLSGLSAPTGAAAGGFASNIRVYQLPPCRSRWVAA